MPKRKFDREAAYQPINGASFLTGFAPGFIREGCKKKIIPHVMVGAEYRVNMPLWLAQLEVESAANAKGGSTGNGK